MPARAGWNFLYIREGAVECPSETGQGSEARPQLRRSEMSKVKRPYEVHLFARGSCKHWVWATSKSEAIKKGKQLALNSPEIIDPRTKLSVKSIAIIRRPWRCF